MQIPNGSWSGIAALVIVLAPLSAAAQRAGDRPAAVAAPIAETAPAAPASAAAPPAFLQEVLKDLVPPARSVAPLVAPPTAKSINDAIAALNAKMYAEARAALAEVRLDRLSPYELGVVEVTFFYVAYGEDKLAEARQHLLNAVASGGLSEQEIAATQRNIERINARLAEAPLTT
jgi:hypothetical protein